MAAATGTSFKVLGLTSAMKYLLVKQKAKEHAAKDAIHKAGFFIEKEVKMSIAGQRDETRSVDTGRFLNSVNTDNSQEYVSVVSSDVSYAPALEFGTSRIQPRRHFRNTIERNREAVRLSIKKAIDQG